MLAIPSLTRMLTWGMKFKVMYLTNRTFQPSHFSRYFRKNWWIFLYISFLLFGWKYKSLSMLFWKSLRECEPTHTISSQLKPKDHYSIYTIISTNGCQKIYYLFEKPLSRWFRQECQEDFFNGFTVLFSVFNHLLSQIFYIYVFLIQ